MLEQLSKKNKKWLKMAYSICGDYILSQDLVNDMYIKIYEELQKDPDKEIKDAFVWGCIRSAFIDSCRKQQNFKMVSLDVIENKPNNDNTFELHDEDLKLIEKAKELRYIYRYYLEKNYDYSIREIAEINGVNYGMVYKYLKHARKHILENDIDKYKNKRNKR